MDVVNETTEDIEMSETNKRRKLETPASVSIPHEGGIVEVVLTTPVTMIATSNISHLNNNHINSNNNTNLPNNNIIGNGINANNTQQQQKDRFVPFDHCKTEQIALLTALSQVVSCTQEAVKILKESQERSLDLEHKRFRFQLEAEEKRLMMESEHYRKMETMFSSLIQAISQTPCTSTSAPSPKAQTDPVSTEQHSASSPTTVKVEVDT